MSRGVTEIAVVPIPSTTKIEDTSTKEGETWASCLDTLNNTNGVQSHYWSRYVENPDLVHVMINWESIQHHQNFTAAPDFPKFEKGFVSVTNAPITMYHAHLTPHPPTNAFMAPVMEVFTAYFHATLTEEEKEAYYKNLKNFVEQMIVDAKGLVAEAHGWVVEEITHNEEKSRAFTLCIGWESIEKHQAHRETASFKESIHLLREGTRSVEVHHVKFSE